MTTAREMPSWVAPLARVGCATKGIVYLMVGGLAVLAALGKGGKVDGSEGAVRALGEQPFGRFLVLGSAVGLLAYAVWRMLQAGLDLQAERGAKGAITRIGFAISGLVHAGLALTAFQLARGAAGGGGSSTRPWIARLLGQPFGPLLIGAIGVGLIGYGVKQLYCAATARLDPALGLGGIRGREQRWLVNLGRFGLAARGVVFGVIGYHLIRAGMVERAGESRDTGGAMREIGQQAYGDLLLFGVASGLAAYGVYMLMCAFFARIRAG